MTYFLVITTSYFVHTTNNTYDIYIISLKRLIISYVWHLYLFLFISLKRVIISYVRLSLCRLHDLKCSLCKRNSHLLSLTYDLLYRTYNILSLNNDLHVVFRTYDFNFEFILTGSNASPYFGVQVLENLMFMTRYR